MALREVFFPFFVNDGISVYDNVGVCGYGSGSDDNVGVCGYDSGSGYDTDGVCGYDSDSGYDGVCGYDSGSGYVGADGFFLYYICLQRFISSCNYN